MRGLDKLDWANYRMAQPSGTIPDEFLEASSAAYDRDRERITRQDSRIARKAKKEFFLESNFVINRMLHSGKVLFGDPMSRYLNDVADRVLVSDPELREGLRFYTVRSGAVNAFATDRGSIFMTLGLLARLENEAQLAFILAHEAAHVQEKHTVRLAIESAKLEKLRDLETQLLEGSRYSQGQETEADRLGLDLMKASPYPEWAAAGALAILDREHRPFDADVALRPTAFAPWPLETPDVVSDSTWTALGMDSIGPWLAGLLDRYGMGVFGDPADSVRYPSHPALEDRIAAAADWAKEDGEAGGGAESATRADALNLLGTARFEAVRRMARHELLRQYLLDGAYEKALYAAEALLAEDPDSRYAFEMRARALAGLVVYADEEEDRHATPDPRAEPVFAEFGAWSDQLYRREWLAAGWLKLREWADERPELAVLPALRDTLANRLAIRLYADFKKFPEQDFEALDSARLRRFPYRSWRAALPLVVDWQEDAAVAEALEAAHQRRKGKAVGSGTAKGSRRAGAQRTESSRSDPAAPRILVLDPSYFRVNETSRQPIDYLGAEKRDVRFHDFVLANLRRLDYDPIAVDPIVMESSEAERFGELILLRSAFGEAFAHNAWLPPVDGAALRELGEAYGTDRVLWPFTLAVKDHPNSSAAGAMAKSILLFPLMPYWIYDAAAKDKHTFQVFFLFDFVEGQQAGEASHYMHHGDSRATLQSGMYHCLQELLQP